MSLDRELGEGREVVMVWDVGEMAVVRDEGTVGVAVQVAMTEKGQLAELVDKVVAAVLCQQCMIHSSSKASSH